MNPAPLDEALLRRRLEWTEARSMEGEPLVARDDRGGEWPLQVSRVASRSDSPAMRQFSLVLRGPAEPLLAQAVYAFRHERLGDYAFLITPVGRWEGGVEYEACFSHAP